MANLDTIAKILTEAVNEVDKKELAFAVARSIDKYRQSKSADKRNNTH